jgi:hypothetical protein
MKPLLLTIIAVTALLPTPSYSQNLDGLPDVDVLYIERTPRYPGYKPSYDQPGKQGVPIQVDNKSGKPLSPAEAAAVKRWPAAGETVTFTAHVQNRGYGPAPAFGYIWSIDGKEVERGKTRDAQSVGKEITVQTKWKWLPGRHTVSFVADPLFKNRDLSLGNNRREDATDAWSLIWAVDRVTYESFNKLRNFMGTLSFEDWAQWHIDHMNHLFDISPTPWDAANRAARAAGKPIPTRWRPRIRCDRVVVVDDVEGAWDRVLGQGVQPLDAGYDGAWPFGRRDDCTEWATNVDWGLIHEWGHQLGLTDLYALDRAGFLNQIPDENGDPLLIGHLSSQVGYMMHGHGPTTFSPECMGALMTQEGRRRGYYGDYYFNIPARNYLRILDSTGKPVPGAKLTFWQDTETEYAKPPVFTGNTDTAGLFTFPNRPAPHITTDRGYTQRDNPFGQINVVGSGDVLFMKIEARGHSEYAWIDIPEFNLAYWSTGPERAIFTRATHVPPAGAPTAPTGLTADVTGDMVKLSWKPVPAAKSYQIYHAAPDEYRFEKMDGPVSAVPPAATTLGNGALHRFAVTAITDKGMESGFSNVAGAMHLMRPWGIAVAKDGKRYIRDPHYGQAILQKANGNSVGLVGSVHYHFEGSYDIALDSKGRLLSAKWGDGYDPKPGFKVQNPDLREAFSVLETESSAPGHVSKPMGIAAGPADHIFIADTGNDRVQEFTAEGKFVRVIGAGELKRPMKPAFSPAGMLYIADSGNDRIAVFSPGAEGTYHLTESFRGVKEPVYVAVGRGDTLFVSTKSNGVVMFDRTGKIVWTYRGTPEAPVTTPRGLAFDPQGSLLIVDERTRRVVSVKPPTGV